MRYVRKPITVDAIPWSGMDGVFEVIEDWVKPFPVDRQANDSIAIFTPAGTRVAEIGDMIVRGIEGDVFPMKKPMFDQMYEPLDEEES